ncbi:DUF3822 family protein [Hymenobacter sp. BRD128]|uniref:DUF3822 family protein n=1 Tax=Hymenobacter sp. BRD128 TaxID=2675878 RepID=UPI0015667FA5|nr:DUF3822 family protein [Hymenobacter sp. BRD128]QKG56048.1 DUF3822 family protein [Hymenobacter sp. BRD128]
MSASPTLPATPTLSLRDDTFDATNLTAYHLYALASPNRLRLAAMEAARQKIVAFDDLPATSLADLPALAAGTLLGQAGWARLRLGLAGGATPLLPAPLYRTGDEATYLRLHHELVSGEEALAYTLPLPAPATDIVSLFAAPGSLVQWLQQVHGPSARLLPQTSALLAGLLHQRGPSAAPRQLYLSLADHELTAVVLGAQVEFCNAFTVSTAEDVTYYTILVMQELGLNPDQDTVTIWGELTSDSATFALLSTYVRNLRFGTRPFGLQYFYYLNEVADYRHFDLFSLAFCE